MAPAPFLTRPLALALLAGALATGCTLALDPSEYRLPVPVILAPGEDGVCQMDLKGTPASSGTGTCITTCPESGWLLRFDASASREAQSVKWTFTAEAPPLAAARLSPETSTDLRPVVAVQILGAQPLGLDILPGANLLCPSSDDALSGLLGTISKGSLRITARLELNGDPEIATEVTVQVTPPNLTSYTASALAELCQEDSPVCVPAGTDR